MFLNILAPLPFLKGIKYTEYVEAWDVTIVYEINDILLFFCFLRVYLAFKFILYLTQFMGPRPHRVCNFSACDANTMFAVKSLMKQYPFQILFWGLIISTFIYGYCLRIFEAQLNEASGQNFSILFNCMWNVIITLTTVGYGDLYPKSFWGRVVGIMISFWGVLIVSFFVVTVTNMITFSENE